MSRSENRIVTARPEIEASASFDITARWGNRSGLTRSSRFCTICTERALEQDP